MEKISNVIRPISPEEVYARKELIMNMAKHFHWDYDSGKDLLQAVAIKCWTNPKIRYNPLKGTLEGYLARIAYTTAVDMMRENKHFPVPVEDVELLAKIDAKPFETEDDTELYEARMKLLERGIEEMYRRYPSKEGNDAFVMFSRTEKSAKQVAEELGVEERFVSVAVHRGLERLKKIVRKMTGDDNWRDAC